MASVLLTLCLGVVVSSALAFFLKDFGESVQKFAGMIVFTIFFQGAVVIWVHCFLKDEGITWSEGFGYRNGPARALTLGLGVGAVALPVTLGLSHVSAEILVRVGIKPEAQQAVQQLQEGLGVFQQVYLGIVAIIMAPLSEELLFRGIIYPTISQAGYPRLALWGTSLMFAAIHLNLAAFVPLTIFALILTWAYERTNNLLAPMLIHGLFNAANFIFIIFGDEIQRAFN